MSEPLKVPAGKTVYWRGRTYTEGMALPADYPSPEHLAPRPIADESAASSPRAKER
jgi:hypothetical protein